MGCFPKFNSIPLIETFETASFLRGVLTLNFKQIPNWESGFARAVDWVTTHIKGHPVILTDRQEWLDSTRFPDIHQLWPAADYPADFTSDLINTFKVIFDNGESLSNGDEYVVILVTGEVDLRRVVRMADNIRPVVFIAINDVFHGKHNRFMSRWALDVNPNNTCTPVRNQSGRSGVTLQL